MNAPTDDALQTTVRLLAAARDDDRAAIEELFERYLPRVRRIVALRLGRPIHRFAEFDDVVQDTLLRAFTGLVRLRHPSVGAFRNWLSTCAVNSIRDALRRKSALKRGAGKQRYFGELDDESLCSSVFAGREASPSQHAIGRELEERVEKALLAMDERYREVIILRQLCEMSDQEIAAELGFNTTANVRTVCHRALRKLEEMLGPAR